ncbi:hypothetical protein PIB30_095968 [Stylosanthes scabra]|uniref:Uncharacterized protein n=1 Tax=Stylosanthes scabra TaxID=79078 RepID=A0ABU6SX36_9FABA|nr:hypothetical protein [Stylosanthes scabra]
MTIPQNPRGNYSCFPCSSPDGPKEPGSLHIQGMRFSMFQKCNNFSLMDCGKRKREAADDAIPPPIPSPVRPPVSHTNIPASSARSSPQPTRKELVRALRRNERIMRRHEQLLLMPHPGTDISQPEQISSPEVSEHQQQTAGDPEDEDSSDEDGSDEDSSEE